MGRPRASRIAVVAPASRTLSQIACQSISLSGNEKAVLSQDTASGGGEQEGAEIARRQGILQDDAALVHARIGVQRDLPVAPASTHGRGQCQRQRDDAYVGGSAFHELKRDRDVLDRKSVV